MFGGITPYDLYAMKCHNFTSVVDYITKFRRYLRNMTTPPPKDELIRIFIGTVEEIPELSHVLYNFK